MKINVGVIFGGASVEHEISIISALQAIENFDKSKYKIIPIYIGKNKEWYTGNILFNIKEFKDIDILIKKCKEVILCKIDNEFCLLQRKGIVNKVISKIDIAFPIVHGANVEDGTLAGYLETIGIPYVGSNVLGASIGQDKVILKQILKSVNIPIVDYVWFYSNDYDLNKDKYLNDIKELGYPVIVKPATLGSSIGINYVKNDKVIEDAIYEAMLYDNKIIVEKAVENLIEVNASVLGNYKHSEVSLLEEVVKSDNLLTYEDKYIGSKKSIGMVNTKRIVPANIGIDLTNKIKSTSLDVFKVLNFSGVVRIDYLIDNNTKEYYVNESNTIPGSLAFYLWEKSGKKYYRLLDELMDISIKEYKEKQKKIYSIETNVLKNIDSLNGVKK